MPTDYERYLEAKKKREQQIDTLAPRAITGVREPVAETTGVNIPSLMSPASSEAKLLDFATSSAGSAKDFPEAFRRVAGGALRGLTLRAVDVYKDDADATSSKVAEFVGTLAPWSLIGKGVAAIPWVGRLTKALPVVGKTVQGGITGTAIGVGEEGIAAARGNGFDIETVGEDAATFALLDGALATMGKFGQFLLKTRQDKKLMAELKEAIKRGDLPAMTKQELEGIKKMAMVGDGMPRQIPIGEDDVNALRQMVDLKPKLIPREGKAINVSIENPVYTFDRLGKEVRDVFYETARDAEHVVNVRVKAIKDATDRMAKQLNLGKKESRRIHAFAYSEQQGGKELLASAGVDVPMKIGKDGVPRPGLNSNELEAYKWMRQQFDKRFNEINKAREIAGTQPLPKVDNYFTFSHADEILRRDGFTLTTVTPTAFDQAMRQADDVVFQFEKRGFLGRKTINLDALNLFKRYNESAIRHAEMTPVVARNRELLASQIERGGETMRFSEANPEAYKFINQWNNHIAGMRASVFSPTIEQTMERLNRNVAFGTLSFSVRSALIQPVALNNTVALIGPRWAAHGIRQMLDFSGKPAMAMQKSRVLVGREFDATVMDAMNIGKRLQSGMQRTGEKGLAALKGLDMASAQASWLGAYGKATRALKMSERDAIRFADDIVVKGQASASPLDMAPIQRTALGRSATLFQTFAINEFNMLRRELIGKGNKNVSKKEAAKRLFRWVTGITMANILYEDILNTNSPYPAPINAAMRAAEEGKSPVREYMLEMAGILPIVGGLKYGGSALGATVSTIDDARDVLTGRASLRRSLQTAGKIAGVPGTMQIGKLSRLITEKD